MSDDSALPEFGTPYRVLIDHCEAKEINFRTMPEHKAVFFSLHGNVAAYEVTFFISHDDEVFQTYVTLPVSVSDEKMRPLVSEFVVRANNKLTLGNFDFEIDEGKLRYHAAHAFGPGDLDDETIERLMSTVLETVDRYYPALMRLMYGGNTPADAVFLSELDYHAEAEEEHVHGESTSPPPAATPPPGKKRRRRLRRDPRLKGTKELPGLFDQTGSQDQ
jgi:hypothetical protein